MQQLPYDGSELYYYLRYTTKARGRGLPYTTIKILLELSLYKLVY